MPIFSGNTGGGSSAELTAHIANTANPHAVTKSQVGLGSVDNTADTAKPVSTAMTTALGLKADGSALTTHATDTANPHAVTKAQVGLSAVPNTDATARVNHTGTQSGLSILETIATSAAATLTLDNTASAWIFTGSTATWTLPPVAGNTGVKLWIKNRGSGTLTVQRGGTDNIFAAASTTTTSVATGSSTRLLNDGTYWLTV